MDVLGTSWLDAVAQLGGRRVDAEEAALDLTVRYGQAHRRYHTSTHIEAVLRDVARLAVAVDLTSTAGAEVVLAACAHDVVYDANPGADERASADWAMAATSAARVPAPGVARVRDLVLLTIAHSCDDTDVAAGVLLDADLAVLGGSPRAYDRYVHAVRAEYASVADEGWRTGRGEVLLGLLARDRLFVTAPGHEAWEHAARDNVQRELRSLRAGSW